MTPEQLSVARSQFFGLPERVWFQYGGGGPVPRTVGEAMAEAARATSGDPLEWPARYVADRDLLRASAGRLMGCDASEVALVRSTAHGLSLLAGGLDWQPGDNVVVPRWEFPANVYPWMALADRGVDLRIVDPVGGRVQPQDLLAASDDRTRVVALSLVSFHNGATADVASVGAACRARGILTAVDAIQGLGAVPVDVRALGCDLLTAGAVKWMLGPAGIGVAYVGPRLAGLRPVTVGLGSVADPGRIFDPELVWGMTARRFEESATAWCPIAGMRAGLDFLESVGHAEVFSRVRHNTRVLGDGLTERGWQVSDPWPRAEGELSGLLAFHVGTEEESVLRRLDEAGIFARSYRDTVRLSPHFYVTDDDLERALGAIGRR